MMKKQLAQKFSHWLKTPFACFLMDIEKPYVNRALQVRAGQVVLILGSKQQAGLFADLPTQYVFYTSDHKEEIQPEQDAIVSYPLLPFAPQTFDHIIMPHTLDFSTSYIKTLREANAILKPEGNLTIIGFNIWSLWGLRKLLSIRHKAPWCGYFRSYWRIKDAFELLNYEISNTQRFCYRPPFQNPKLYKFCWVAEVIIKFLFPFAFGAYVVSAKKKIYGLTPLRPQWKMIPAVLAKPMARTCQHLDNQGES